MYTVRSTRCLLITLSLALAATVLVSALGRPSSARADVPLDPVARLQFVIKKIHVRDDNDWLGKGDLHLIAILCPGDGPQGGCGDGGSVRLDYGFHANSGDDVILERVVPPDGDSMPVYAGQPYQFFANIFDHDTFTDEDDMGEIVVHVDEQHGWGIGTFTARSLKMIPGEEGPGDYDLTFEIRRAPLPDLWVKGFQVAGSPGSESVCGQIQNAGPQPSGPFGVTLRTEGMVVEQASLSTLDAGASTWHCFPRSSLPARKHNLVFSLDEARQVPEMEEYNNANVLTVEADPSGTASATGPGSTAPVATPSPQPKPNGTQADLAVRAIRVNGQAPDGKDDCKDGKNNLTVLVKNTGTAEAGSFTVRLAVDGDDIEASVRSLDAGKEREVRFDDVRLRKGERQLTATADAKEEIAESNEGNNTLKVAARCTDNN